MKPINIAILRELANQPAGYLAPEGALRNAIRWAVIPQASYTEIDQAVRELEEARAITRVDSAIYGARYAITDAGRATLQS